MKWLIVCAIVVFVAGCKKSTPVAEGESGLPIVRAAVVSNISAYAIELSANIPESGSSSIIEAGFVLDSTHLPTIDDNLFRITGEVDANGNVSAEINNLLANTTYFARVYAKNGSGVAYSEEISFSTLDEKTHDGDVELGTQQELVSFAAQHNNRINGYLIIYGTVTDLTPLADLVTVTKELNISFTTQLKSLNGLQNLKSVNTDKSQKGIILNFNEALEDLHGLEGITSSYGTMTIYRNYNLTSLEGLNNFKTLTFGQLSIDDCDKIESLHGLESLEVASESLVLNDNDRLADVSALQKLSSTKLLSVSRNAILSNLNGLHSLKSIWNLSLFHNPNLSNISGLSGLEEIELVSIDSNKLANLGGLENVQLIKVLSIFNSSELTDISALSGLRDLTTIQVYKTGLKDLQGLEGINVLQVLELRFNSELESLKGLDNVQKVENRIDLVGNPKLNSILSLSNVTDVYLRVYIENNSSLGEFCALKSVLQKTYNVEFTTLGNASNPTRDEVIANCP